jgi:hypothetical protein
VTIEGADVEALRGLASSLQSAAGELERISTSLRSSLYALPWMGHDFQMITNDWERQYGPQLNSTATSLRSAAQVISRNADQQNSASTAAGGALGSAGSSGLTTTLVSDAKAVANKAGWVVGPLLGAIPVVGSFVTMASTVDSYGRLTQDLADGHDQAAFEQGSSLTSSAFFDVAAKSLKSGDPAVAGTAALVGANVVIWTDVEKAGRQVDWSYTFSHLNQLDPLAPGALSAIGGASEQAFKMVGGQLAESAVSSVLGLL